MSDKLIIQRFCLIVIAFYFTELTLNQATNIQQAMLVDFLSTFLYTLSV